MVAKFLDDNKSKRHLKSGFPLFKLHRSHLICQMLAKFSGLNRKGPYLSLEKENFCVVLTYSIKRASELRKFHVAVIQQRLRNGQKSVIHVQSCSFASLNLLLFCCFKKLLPCSKRSDCGERCEVKKEMKSRGRLRREVLLPRFYFSRSFLLCTAPQYLNAWSRLKSPKRAFSHDVTSAILVFQNNK